MEFQGVAMDHVGRVFGDVLGEDPFGTSGASGKFVFADLDHLDAVIRQWQAERDKIHARDNTISQALMLAVQPAEDMMSAGQAERYSQALNILQARNNDLRDYADNYIQKLKDSRAHYGQTEHVNWQRMFMRHLHASA